MAMYPLSFHEFLRNTGISEEVLEYVRKSFKEHAVIEKTIHESLLSLYYQYLIVGGMPEAVSDFFEKHDLNSVRDIQRRILSSIWDDFGRYKDNDGNDKVTYPLYAIGFIEKNNDVSIVPTIDVLNLKVPETT